jgi:hypothetical protein
LGVSLSSREIDAMHDAMHDAMPDCTWHKRVIE